MVPRCCADAPSSPSDCSSWRACACPGRGPPSTAGAPSSRASPARAPTPHATRCRRHRAPRPGRPHPHRRRRSPPARPRHRRLRHPRRRPRRRASAQPRALPPARRRGRARAHRPRRAHAAPRGRLHRPCRGAPPSPSAPSRSRGPSRCCPPRPCSTSRSPSPCPQDGRARHRGPCGVSPGARAARPSCPAPARSKMTPGAWGVDRLGPGGALRGACLSGRSPARAAGLRAARHAAGRGVHRRSLGGRRGYRPRTSPPQPRTGRPRGGGADPRARAVDALRHRHRARAPQPPGQRRAGAHRRRPRRGPRAHPARPRCPRDRPRGRAHHPPRGRVPASPLRGRRHRVGPRPERPGALRAHRRRRGVGGDSARRQRTRHGPRRGDANAYPCEGSVQGARRCDGARARPRLARRGRTRRGGDARGERHRAPAAWQIPRGGEPRPRVDPARRGGDRHRHRARGRSRRVATC
jgi:hypothetical protein